MTLMGTVITFFTRFGGMVAMFFVSEEEYKKVAMKRASVSLAVDCKNNGNSQHLNLIVGCWILVDDGTHTADFRVLCLWASFCMQIVSPLLTQRFECAIYCVHQHQSLSELVRCFVIQLRGTTINYKHSMTKNSN